jgi:hypothetical protein
MIQDCETLAIDANWSLTRKNACHIANQNEEMGSLRDAQLEFNYRLDSIENYVSFNTWVWGVIGATIIGIAIKRIFTN